MTTPAGQNGKRVVDILHENHPQGQPAKPEVLLRHHHPVIFKEITRSAIHSATFRVEGGAGPSGLDAQDWRHLCTSFGRLSDDLCETLAGVAKRLCTENITEPLSH